MLSVSSLLLAIGIFSSCYCHEWGYQNTNWPGLCQEGPEQSPIDLNYYECTPRGFEPLEFYNYSTPHTATVTNNGHSISVRFTLSRARVAKGGLPEEEYSLDHFHFHWGSEHTLMRKRLPLEMHLVHFATKYKTLSEALKHKGGVAVFGVLFHISPDDDLEFREFGEAMKTVVPKINSSATTKKLTPNSFLPRDTAGFFRYNGSLTTPACTEGIVWTVFTSTMPISEQQVIFFQQSQDSQGRKLTKNYRPIQKLNGRKLYHKMSPLYSKASQATPITFAFISLLVLKFL